MDDLSISFKKEKKNLENIFQQQLENERTEMKMELLQMKMNNGNGGGLDNEEWQHTKI